MPSELQGLNTYLALLQSGGSQQFPGLIQQQQSQGLAAAPQPPLVEQPQVEQEPALWIRRETLEQVQRVPPNEEEPENGVAGGQRLLMNVVLSAIPHSYYGQVPLYTKLNSEHNHA